MNNFQFSMSTQVYFGKDEINHLPEIISQFGKRVLLTYGGGSIKRMGIYDKVKELLADCDIFEVSGIVPNPRIESVREGVELCKKEKVDVVLAVGGGSVIDCSKGIVAGACYEGDAWDLISGKQPIRSALPLIAIPTMAATGSECDAGAVVSDMSIHAKQSFFSPLIQPKAAILDPTYTFSVSKKQTAAGSADIFTHLLEQYFLPATNYMSDMLVESVMKTIIRYAPVALTEPDNYEARAQLLLGSNIADNATLACGNQLAVFGVHAMEHELSAFYDITHGVGLAILEPRWMRYVLNEKTESRFAHYGKAVWGIDEKLSDHEIAEKAIQATEDWLRSLGIPMSLSEVGIGEEHFEDMAQHCVEHEGVAYAWIPLTKKDIVDIFKSCL